MLDLVPQSAVKVNDVTVGAVEKVALDGWHARVTVRLAGLGDAARQRRRRAAADQPARREVRVARRRRPTEAAAGRLGGRRHDPAAPAPAATRRSRRSCRRSPWSSTAAASPSSRRSTSSSTKALEGREADVQGAIRQLDTFIGGLDEQKAEIVRALDGLDRLSARLAAQKDDIAPAIEDLGPGLTVLADQREQLTADADRALRPRPGRHPGDQRQQGRHRREPARPSTRSCTRLAEAGDDLPNALEMLLTYPFPQAATGAIEGDYANLRITADLDLRTILANLNGGKDPGLPTLPPPDRRCRPSSHDAADRPARRTCPRPADRPADRLPAGAPRPSPRPPPGGGGGGGGRSASRAICACTAARSTAGAVRHQPGPADDGGLRMIRRGVKVQLVVFLIITIVGVSYVSARYVGLGDAAARRPATSSPPTSRESGGIFENAEVTYRGVAVGRVDRLRLADDGVHVDLRIDERRRGARGHRAPSSRTARPSASSTSTCSRAPQRARTWPTATASRSDDTRTPLHTEELLLNLDRLVQLGRQARPGGRHRRARARRSPAPAPTCSGCSTPATR